MDRIRRLLIDHRRLLAAALAGLAVLAALGSVRADTPPSEPVVVVARDLPSGTVIGEDDVEQVRLDPDRVPDHAVTDIAAVVGQRLSGPVRRGEAVTDARLLGPGALLGRPDGTVVATVRVADPVELESVGPGERVDVVAVVPDARDGRPGASVVAEGLEVVSTDVATDDPGGTATLRVATDREVAVRLAEASVDARLGVLVTADPPAS